MLRYCIFVPMLSAGTSSAVDETRLLERARTGDNASFDALVAPYRGQLHAHCYRMLGSFDDALQDALLSAWKGCPVSRAGAGLVRISPGATLLCFVKQLWPCFQ